jgi:hypothetical protein
MCIKPKFLSYWCECFRNGSGFFFSSPVREKATTRSANAAVLTPESRDHRSTSQRNFEYFSCFSSSSAPHFSDYSIWVHHPVNQDDRQLLAHAMASDFSVAWQFSRGEHFLNVTLKMFLLLFLSNPFVSDHSFSSAALLVGDVEISCSEQLPSFCYVSKFLNRRAKKANKPIFVNSFMTLIWFCPQLNGHN